MNSSAIAPVLLELFIKSAVIIVAASLLNRAFRRISAAKRHFIWAGAFGALLLLPLTKFVKPHWALFLEKPERAAVIHPGPIVELETVTEPLPALLPATPAKAQFHLPGWRNMVIVVWFAGSALVISYRLLGSIHLAMLKRRSTMINDRRFDNLMRNAVSEFSIKRPIASRFATDARVPFTWGILRPVLLFPPDCSLWSDERFLAALRHELAHIARNDYLVRLISQFVTALYWPNPLVWLAGSSLRSSQEQACDDRVLRLGTPAEDYATLLFESAKVLANGDARTRYALAMARPSTLESRVVAIVDDTRDRRPAGRFAAFGAIPFVAVSLGVSAFAQLQNNAPAPPGKEPISDVPGGLPRTVDEPGALRRKAKTIILPSINFKEATLLECVKYLRDKSVELDPENDPEKKGISFVLKLSAEDPGWSTTITMNLQNIPLSEAVRYVAELSNVRVRYERYAIAFVDQNSGSGVLFQKEYKLPRDLFPDDTTGLRPDSALGAYTRVDAFGFLKSKGITFPDGASGVYIARSQRLIVRNTEENMDRLDEIVAEIVANQPTRESAESENTPAKEDPQPAITATNAKLAKIVLPKLVLKEATLKGAVLILERTIKELDPETTGVKFSLTLNAEKIDNTTTISLSKIPADEALKYVTSLAGAKFWVATDGSVNIASMGELALITKQYRVPTNSVDQPSGTVRGPDGKAYSSAQEFFSAFGVGFPVGASAGLPVGGGSIALHNTQENLDRADIIVAALVDAKGGTLSQAELDALRKLLADRK
jgi:beta-lactamase regulating signal transducer with metallopeptidase domain